MKYIFFGIIFVITFLAAKASIYQQTDAKGNISYSDEPMGENSQIVTISDKPINSISSMKEAQPKTINTTKVDSVPVTYTTFNLVSPRSDETFQNPTSIPVEVTVTPDLQKGDMIQIYVDGKAWQAPAPNLKQNLVQVERGAHRIQAKIIDSKLGIKQQSNIATIYVQRASILNKSLHN